MVRSMTKAALAALFPTFTLRKHFSTGVISMRLKFLLATSALFVPGAAFAQAAPDAAPAAATSQVPALCTDRPTKATSACTVPKGMVQIESDLINFTRLEIAGVKVDTILYTSPTIKYGLGNSTDIEASITPYETIRVHGGGLGSSSISGVGDLYLKVKQRFSDPSATNQFVLIPYVKVPTAKFGIGNRKVEGGVIGTGQFGLGGGFTLTASPEIDLLADSDLHGGHVQLVGALNLGKTLTSSISASVEVWTAQNYDPAGTVRQYSVDGGLAWIARPNLQFDVGANLGLNQVTPGVQVYAGASTRF